MSLDAPLTPAADGFLSWAPAANEAPRPLPPRRYTETGVLRPWRVALLPLALLAADLRASGVRSVRRGGFSRHGERIDADLVGLLLADLMTRAADAVPDVAAPTDPAAVRAWSARWYSPALGHPGPSGAERAHAARRDDVAALHLTADVLRAEPRARRVLAGVLRPRLPGEFA
ncbi:hypothetical protein [Cellulosimicrobium sp. TH-20]|uniref:hypothetical protein n=1 Tax=Cellulosimicrobium sp. TH-20 TaxID=1980001 RepID=UPI0011A4CA3B|nr:hypothetical protein [Cellulosimicrobium sp. TH-20]